VRPDFVVAAQPVVGDLSHFADRIEQVGVEYLLAVGAVEPLDVRVLVGLAWLDEAQLDVRGHATRGEVVAGELRTVVAADRRRPAVNLDQLLDEANHPCRRDTRRQVNHDDFFALNLVLVAASRASFSFRS
jgi:hypothetical protein